VETVLQSRTRSVTIGPEHPFVIIGERINPTGRKQLTEELLRGDMETVRADAIAQVGAGADVLDLNVGAVGADEVRLLPDVVTAVQDVVDAPLCIDSPKHDALEAALKACDGKPLVNSVTGEDHSLDRILPKVREHGAAVIGLAHGDAGISMNPPDRLDAARRIVERADELGISAEDVIIDPLVMSVGADPQAADIALETMRLVRQELGANLVCGLSNVSHGLPGRADLSSAFLAMAIQAGLTCAIANPQSPQVMRMARTAEVLAGRDPYAKRWIRAYREEMGRSGGD
jgi:5-methyltetrahydrofolate--homocysteine methyltransferase